MMQPVDNRAERVMDCLHERFVLVGLDLTILIVNEAALPNFAKKEDILGRNLFDAYPNLQQQGFKKILESVISTGIPHVELSVEHTTIDGFSGFHHRKVLPFQNSLGEMEGVLIVIENVHEEHLAQVQSRQTEFEYTQLIETLQLVSFELNASGTIVDINKAVKPVLGFEQEQLIGKSFTSCIHPDDVRMTWHIYWQIVNLGKPFGVCENRFVTADGSFVHMRWNIHPLYDRHGAIIGCRGVGENITADRTLVQELRGEIRMYDETLQAAPTPIIVIKKGEIVKINRAFHKLMHVSMRSKSPTLNDVGEQLRTNEIQTLCESAEKLGTARASVAIMKNGVEIDVHIVAIRIHDAIVVAIEPLNAVQ
jgi:PAS domain S-box-containing protein